MAVYAGPLAPVKPGRGWKYAQSCVLVSDDPDELKELVSKARIPPKFFRPAPFPHYELTEFMRTQAVGFGAVEAVNPKSAAYEEYAGVVRMLTLKARRGKRG